MTREGYKARCKMTMGEEMWYDHDLPLPIGASRKEALRAVNQFFDHQAPRIAEAHCYHLTHKHGELRIWHIDHCVKERP